MALSAHFLEACFEIFWHIVQFEKRRCRGHKVGFISFITISDDFEVRKGPLAFCSAQIQ